MHSYRLTHLKELESESIHILREVASQFDNPTLLFSGGKDSTAEGSARRRFGRVRLMPSAPWRRSSTTWPAVSVVSISHD